MSSCSLISVLNFSQMSLSSSGSPRIEISFENFNSQKFENTINSYSSRNQILNPSGSPTSCVDNVLNINFGKLKTSSSLNSIFDFNYKKTSLEGSVSQESILNKFPNFNFLNIHNSSSPKDYSVQFNYFDKLEGENEKILIINDFPNLGFQFHIHEINGEIKEAGLKKYGENKQFEVLFPKKLNSYDLSMSDLYANLLGIGRIIK